MPLELGIEGGVDLQPSLVDGPLPVLLGKLFADRIQEILVVVLVLDAFAVQGEILRASLLVLVLRYVTVVEHPFQNDVATGSGAPKVRKRIVRYREG